MKSRTVGIYAGTFDPIHAGHLAFALQALEKSKLDHIFFLPERRPRYKSEVEHFGHRTAMISRAIRPYKNLSLLELPDMYFDISRTLPKLQSEFKGYKLDLLMGSDVVFSLKEWPDIETLLNNCSLTVGLRGGSKKAELIAELESLGANQESYKLIKSRSPHVAASVIRRALNRNSKAEGLLPSVRRYARKQWLYTSVSSE